MKKILLIIILIGFGIFQSCEQFLEEDPQAKLSQSSFYHTLEDLKTAVNGIYVPLYQERTHIVGSHTSFGYFMGADDLTTHPASNKSNWRVYDQFNITPSSAFLERGMWKAPYKVINQCNAIIEVKDQLTGNADEINKYTAIAYFWRAWSHFLAVRMYGDIPLITSTVVDLEMSRTPTLEVYQQVESDLLEAIKYLPTEWSEENYPNIWAAKTLLADVYITWAGWPLKDESKYALSAQYSKDVMDNSGAALLEDFADLWRYDPYGTYDNHKEVVFQIVASSIEQAGNNKQCRVVGRSFSTEDENYRGVSGWSDFMSEIGFYNRFPEGYRKDVTFTTEITKSDGSILHWTEFSTGHPYYAKYRGTYEYIGTNAIQSGDNFEVYRYADVLLLYAEAKAMSGSPDASAYEAINKVRRRANKLPIDTPDALVDLTPGLSKTDFRDAVIDERAWEFAAEQRRWFDLIRTEKLEWAMSLKDPADLPPLQTVSKNNYIYPLPYVDVSANPNLEQNPGY